MRQISTFFKALRSLGCLGVILALSAGIIAWSGLSVFSLMGPLGNGYIQTEKRDILGDIEYWLTVQEINQVYFLIMDPYVKAEYVDSHTQASSEIDDCLSTYESSWLELNPPGEELGNEQHAIEALKSAQQAYQQTFAQLVTAINAGNEQEASQLQVDTEAQIQAMRIQVDDLLKLVEINLLQSVQQATQLIQKLIVIGAICLIILPLLGAWAFAIASQMTQPLLALTTAITAIEGNQSHPELLADITDQRGEMGRLARSIEQLAQTVKERKETLEGEIARLQEQLYETRRRKRLPTSPKREQFES